MCIVVILSLMNLLGSRGIETSSDQNVSAGLCKAGLASGGSVLVEDALDDCFINNLVCVVHEGGNGGQISLAGGGSGLECIKSGEDLLHAGGNLRFARFVVQAGLLCCALSFEGVLFGFDGESGCCNDAGALWESCKRFKGAENEHVCSKSS